MTLPSPSLRRRIRIRAAKTLTLSLLWNSNSNLLYNETWISLPLNAPEVTSAVTFCPVGLGTVENGTIFHASMGSIFHSAQTDDETVEISRQQP